MLLFFGLTSYPAEIAYFNSPNGELSYGVRVIVRTYQQYSDHVRSSRNVIFGTFNCSYSSALRTILLKLHMLTRLIESFPMMHRLWSCIEIEMSIPLGA